ncbi:MAG: hypothetical protein IJO00_02030 [Clostridia bacterium]|nr:hypothetical protein [Clostridia bacterium]
MLYEIFISEVVDEYSGVYLTYGIRAIKDSDVIFEICDVSTDLALVSEIVSSLNSENIPPYQAGDIISDMIA